MNNFFNFVVGPLAILIQFYAVKYQTDDFKLTMEELAGDSNLPRLREYDFIIVGGGAAGCVLANRLSNDYNVLLLEAGGTPVPATDTLMAFGQVIMNDLLQYEFKSVAQEFASLDSDGIMTQRPGRMLGGSSSHNAYVFNRGHPLDFDEWADITKDPSWTYENVLEYFKKLENFVGSGDDSQHGKNGPMNIETFGNDPTLDPWMKAGKELGFKTYTDPNGPQEEGFSPIQMTRENGRRVTSYTAYIRPIESSRKSLKVERYAAAEEILIDATKRAYGVSYYRHGIPQIAHASKEVIISAGAYGSPILLMKSGIGPANNLREAGIEVISNLTVGIGGREHLGIELAPFSVTDTSIFPTIEANLTQEALMDFFERGEGYATRPLTGAQALLVSSRAKQDGHSTWPDLQIDFEVGITVVGIPHFNFSVLVGLNRPKSKGWLKLNTTAYREGKRGVEDLAVVDYQFMTDPTDADVIVEGIMLSLEIFETTDAFKKYGVKFDGQPHEKCTQFEFRSKDYWLCHITQITLPLNHFTSTCAMGFGPGDQNAVLDSKLNVIGVSRLKVVDGSVMPLPVNSNPTAAIIMIAEKAADEILTYWDDFTQGQDFGSSAGTLFGQSFQFIVIYGLFLAADMIL